MPLRAHYEPYFWESRPWPSEPQRMKMTEGGEGEKRLEGASTKIIFGRVHGMGENCGRGRPRPRKPHSRHPMALSGGHSQRYKAGGGSAGRVQI